MSGEFGGKIVIVTGGAAGLGRAMCLEFARLGAQVVCGDIDPSAGQELLGWPPGWPGRFISSRAICASCRRAIDWSRRRAPSAASTFCVTTSVYSRRKATFRHMSSMMRSGTPF